MRQAGEGAEADQPLTTTSRRKARRLQAAAAGRPGFARQGCLAVRSRRAARRAAGARMPPPPPARTIAGPIASAGAAGYAGASSSSSCQPPGTAGDAIRIGARPPGRAANRRLQGPKLLLMYAIMQGKRRHMVIYDHAPQHSPRMRIPRADAVRRRHPRVDVDTGPSFEALQRLPLKGVGDVEAYGSSGLLSMAVSPS